ncbi:hypothetical protein OIU78_010258 [Salix suchowensis]|nr:hypothetical protein OIU78_010258 [Salix suchowensis]
MPKMGRLLSLQHPITKIYQIEAQKERRGKRGQKEKFILLSLQKESM